MKNLFYSIVIFVMSATFFANQSSAQVGVGAQLGVFSPIGDNSGDAHFGFNVNGKYDLDDRMRIGANLGYYFNRETVDLGFMGSMSFTTFFMPITALFEYDIIEEGGVDVYGGLDLGLYRFGSSFDGSSDSSGNFGIAPTAGVRYGITESLFIDGGLKYHLIFTEGESSSAIGLNGGVIFYF